MNREEELKQLGAGETEYKYSYDSELLETFQNAHQGNDYWVTLNADEFTSLCPITNQPTRRKDGGEQVP